MLLPDTPPTGEWRGMPLWQPRPRKRPSECCATCGRQMTRYDRPLTNTMALKLIHVHQLQRRHPNTPFIHVKDFDGFGGRGEFGTLSKWGLVEEPPKGAGTTKRKISGGRTIGMWGLTDFGRSFVAGAAKVPSHVLLKWGSELLGFAGGMVGIKTCLNPKNRFNYEELMSADIEKYQQLTLDKMFWPKAI